MKNRIIAFFVMLGMFFGASSIMATTASATTAHECDPGYESKIVSEAWTETIEHDAEYGIVSLYSKFIEGSPAEFETIEHPAVYETVVVPAVLDYIEHPAVKVTETHWQKQYSEKHWLFGWSDWKPYPGVGAVWSVTMPDHLPGNTYDTKYRWTAINERTVETVPAWTETIVVTPETTEEQLVSEAWTEEVEVVAAVPDKTVYYNGTPEGTELATAAVWTFYAPTGWTLENEREVVITEAWTEVIEHDTVYDCVAIPVVDEPEVSEPRPVETVPPAAPIELMDRADGKVAQRTLQVTGPESLLPWVLAGGLLMLVGLGISIPVALSRR